MTSVDTLTTLFRHHHWANLQILEKCTELTSDQLKATLTGTYGSILATLQHIVLAERSYFSRISTGQPYHRPKDAPLMTLEDMKKSLNTSLKAV